MSTPSRLLAALSGVALFSLALATPTRAATFITTDEQGGVATVSSPVPGDVFAAGSSATVNAPVGGELFAAGNAVSVTEPVGRSIIAAGNSVTVNRGAAHNAFVAGNTVVLSGTYGNDVYVAGNSVTLTSDAVITGDLHVAAASLTLAGRVGGDAFLVGGAVTSSAAIGGTLKAWSDHVAFTGGSIGGDFTYQSSRDASGLSSVQIGGKTERTDPPARGNGPANWEVFKTWAAVWKAIGTLVLGAILLLLMRRRVQGATDGMRERWSAHFTRGLLFLVLVPVAAIIAFATFVGWQAGLILLLLYVPLIMLANAVGMIFVGDFVLSRTAPSASVWWSLVVGVVVVAILTALPVIGWLFGLVYFFGALLPALGAYDWQAVRGVGARKAEK